MLWRKANNIAHTENVKPFKEHEIYAHKNYLL